MTDATKMFLQGDKLYAVCFCDHESGDGFSIEETFTQREWAERYIDYTTRDDMDARNKLSIIETPVDRAASLLRRNLWIYLVTIRYGRAQYAAASTNYIERPKLDVFDSNKYLGVGAGYVYTLATNPDEAMAKAQTVYDRG